MKENYRDENGELKMRSVLSKAYKEIDVMNSVDYESIPKIKEVFEDDLEDKLYVIMDFIENGTLIDWDEEEQQFYNRLSKGTHVEEEFLSKIALQLAKCLKYRKNI